jgi:hypothetical protein
VAVSLLALGATACLPLPIPHTEQITPHVVGELRRSDGSPLVDTPVALTVWDHDTSCANAVIRRSTDSAGHFALPATKVRKHIFWLTLMENPARSTFYWLCAGTTDSAGEAALRHRTGIWGHLDGDSLACLEWVWLERLRVTCNTEREQRFVTRGDWTDGGTGGTYRVIIAEEEKGLRAHWYAQWLESSRSAAFVTVRAMAEVPADLADKTWYLTTASWVPIASTNGRWYLTVPSIKRTLWGNTRWLRFELGPPGHMRQVPGR